MLESIIITAHRLVLYGLGKVSSPRAKKKAGIVILPNSVAFPLQCLISFPSYTMRIEIVLSFFHKEFLRPVLHPDSGPGGPTLRRRRPGWRSARSGISYAFSSCLLREVTQGHSHAARDARLLREIGCCQLVGFEMQFVRGPASLAHHV